MSIWYFNMSSIFRSFDVSIWAAFSSVFFSELSDQILGFLIYWKMPRFTRKVDKNHIYVFSWNWKTKTENTINMVFMHDTSVWMKGWKKKLIFVVKISQESNGGTIWFLSFHAIIIIVITIFNYISLNVVWIEIFVCLHTKIALLFTCRKIWISWKPELLSLTNPIDVAPHLFVSFRYSRYFKTRQNGVFKSMKLNSMAPGS